MRRVVLLVTVAIALGSGLAACSTATNGTAVPGGGGTNEPPLPPTGEPTRSSTNRPGTGTNAGKLKDTDPCSLLTASGKAQLGLSGPGKKELLGAGRSCEWELRAQDGNLHVFGVTIYDNLGLDDFPSDIQVQKIPDIGKHKAVRSPASQGGACSVILGVTDSSRVSMTAVAGVDVQKGCELAQKLAELVEPELP